MAVPANVTVTRAAGASMSAADWALLIIRLALGVVFFVHGAQKVLGLFGGPGLEGTVGFMGQMGIPAWLAYVACFAEFLGGIFLFFGFLSRLGALAIAIEMIVAIVKVHQGNGFFMNWSGKQGGEGYEYHILAIAMCLAILLAGPGRMALTDFEGRLFRR